MLVQEDLQDRLNKGFQNIFKEGIKNFMKSTFPMQTEVGDALADRLSDIFCNSMCDQLAEVIATNIDTYIKNISITGTVITNGSPTTQVAQIIIGPSPAVSGTVPNTLGIK